MLERHLGLLLVIGHRHVLSISLLPCVGVLMDRGREVLREVGSGSTKDSVFTPAMWMCRSLGCRWVVELYKLLLHPRALGFFIFKSHFWKYPDNISALHGFVCIRAVQ